MKPLTREHLAKNIVVWIVHVSQSTDSLDSLDACLDDRDRDRAARFRFPEDRARFILGRGLIRTSLGQLLSLQPQTISLDYTDRDRPVFTADPSIQFSISHTNDLVGLALAIDARVGLDLEFMKLSSDLPALARRILSDADFLKFQSLPESETRPAFFRIWTRKEAYLKARGEGITDGLQKISVSFGQEEITSIEDIRDETGAESWRFFSLSAPNGYQGSVACDSPERHLDCHFVHLKSGEFVRDS